MHSDTNFGSIFAKQDPRGGGTFYIQAFGHNRTAHQIARDFGHEEAFKLLMRHSPEEVKPEQAYELGDGDIFRSLLARRPNLVETLSDEERRCIAHTAQNNDTNAVRLMLGAG